MDQKTLPIAGIAVVVDNREASSHIESHLENLGAVISRKNLVCGDYLCSEKVVVERKTVSDFLSSVMDQRIFRQLEAMKEAYENPVLIIEGNPDLLFLEREIHPNMIRGALSTIALDFRIPIIWTSSSKETAAQVFWMAKREQMGSSSGLSIRTGRKGRTLQESQEFLVSGLPGINSMLSKRLLEEFKTPQMVFSATKNELQNVEGIGKEKAKKIWELLNGDYKADSKG